MIRQSERGQTLIEVIMAIGLIVLVLVTLVAGLSLGVRNNRFARDQVLAKDFVRQGQEWVRSQRDRLGWDSFYQEALANGSGTVYCMQSIPDTFAELPSSDCLSTQTISGTSFLRTLTLTLDTSDGTPQIQAQVTVDWNDGGKAHQSYSVFTLKQWL
jgi:type II secretory pathway pseudopilin PulG